MKLNTDTDDGHGHVLGEGNGSNHTGWREGNQAGTLYHRIPKTFDAH